MRWKAPADTAAIHLRSGSLEVKDGHVAAPDDLSIGDLSGLNANGFVPAPEAVSAAQPAAPVKPAEDE